MRPSVLLVGEGGALRPMGNISLMKEAMGGVTTAVKVLAIILASAHGDPMSVPRRCMGTLPDRRIGHLAFTLELVNPYSRRQMVDQGYLARALAQRSGGPATEAKLAKMRAFMAFWLADSSGLPL